MHTILIVGGGFCGSTLAARLLSREAPPRVILFNSTGDFGPGLAYSTSDPDHLLNVPAGNMSALDDEPSHFLRWAQGRIGDAASGSFLPRWLYGEYLREVLEAAERAAPGRLVRVASAVDALGESHGRASNGSGSGSGWTGIEAITAAGERFTGDLAVLALGNFPPADPCGVTGAALASGLYVRNPWAPGALEPALGARVVVLLGTGLTMYDAALTLGRAGRGVQITAISRRGLLPAPHRTPARPPPPRSAPASVAQWDGTARGLLHLVRSEVRAAAAAGEDWREVITSLRPVTPRLWADMGTSEQARFLCHVRQFWEVHRHRAAGDVAARITGMMRAGTLRVSAARVRGIDLDAGRLRLTIRPRGTDTALDLYADAVINCTGPATDPARVDNPLLGNTLTTGLVRADALRLGLDCDPAGAAISRDGGVSGRLFVVGPLRRGQLWETTAVPELRRQVHELADALDSRRVFNPSRRLPTGRG